MCWCPLDERGARRAGGGQCQRDLRSVAIAFMHAWLNPAHEARAAAIAREIGFTQITTSPRRAG
jgi:5-oxoprolinase (ATP-hydrolysing)